MYKILTLCFFFTIFFAKAQDTLYFDKHWEETLDTAKVEYIHVLNRDIANPDIVWEKTFLKSGQIFRENLYSSYEKKELHGKTKTWWKDGGLRTESDYRNGELHGFLLSYWENGQMKRKDVYRKGEWKKGTTWDSVGNEVEWYPMEVKPKFPGGQEALVKYLKKHGKKPEGIAGGKVMVGFVIDVDGSITDVRIIKSTSVDLNDTAYQLVAKMPAWTPGKQDGEYVKVHFALPLEFR